MGALPMFENLPLGFRFKPTDVELIDHYLRLKVNGKDGEIACIKEVDICRVEPWDLPDLSAIRTNDHEWFFFCPRDRKYPNGQRSNRATGAGYWKATGKDRTIKSRKMGLIGMKKTLVFYTGRAPKGQRTHWVIHEYRTTLQEMDGTNPGQEAFVLCRLFKKADDVKQDENDDGSNAADEFEINVLSPHPTLTSQEDLRSRPAVEASPLSVEQNVELYMMQEKIKAKTSDSVKSEAIMLNKSCCSCGHSYQGSLVNDELTNEVDSRVNESVHFGTPSETDSHLNDVKYDRHDSVEAQMQLQMNVNQGTLDMDYLLGVGDSYTGMESQGVNGSPISDFLDSILINPDDPFSVNFGSGDLALMENEMLENIDGVSWKKAYTTESGSCSESEVDVRQVQDYTFVDDDNIFSDAALDRFCNLPNAGEQYNAGSSLVNSEGGGNNVGSKIQLRSFPRRAELVPANYVPQGTASRRIRLKKFDTVPVPEAKENVSELTVAEESCFSVTFVEKAVDNVDSSAVASPEDTISLAEICDNPAAAERVDSCIGDDQVVETGIKVRTPLRKIQPSSSNCVKQGTASRRIRLKKHSGFPDLVGKDYNARSLATEIKTSSEDDQKLDSRKRSPSVLSKSLGQRLPSAVYVMLVIIVCLFMACIGLWKARNAIILSS